MPVENSFIATLRRAGAERPDREYLRIAGHSFSYAAALEMVETTARGLRAIGIAPGDRVGVMCRNLPEAVWAWLGANAARAIDVPFNAEARGRLLAYFVRDAEPRVLVGTEEFLTILAETIDVDPEVVVCVGGHSSEPFGDRARHLRFEDLLELGASSRAPLEEPRPGETATIMYTSGTTGPSKGVMVPQRYYPVHGAIMERLCGLRADEVAYCVQPLFHIDARTYAITAAHVRGTLALGSRFSVSRFWDEVRSHNASVFATVGTMLWLLYKQPPRPDDDQLPARMGMCSSTPKEILRDFEQRFGVEINEAYGMTECVCLAGSPPGGTVPGRVGRPVPGITVRIVDEDDAAVAPGTVGELCYRPEEPYMMMQGYWRKPEDTTETWRNLWFHTGDFLRQHPDGTLEYIGRKKDSIRRRGENVSAWEVERAVSAHPDVLEAAALGVPSDVGEEDVAVLVVLRERRTLYPADLSAFVAADLPRFAVPRYIEFVDSLPKTPSERIAKGKVRERGITSAAWDANVALGRR